MTGRERLDEPPETTVDRLARRVWGGYGDLLHKVLGRYYDPLYRSILGLVLMLGSMGIYGLHSGIEGARQVLFAAGFILAGTLWMLYRSEQRWRDTSGRQ